MLDFMLVNPLLLQKCLDKVDEINAQYRLHHLGSDDPWRSVENLRLTVQTDLGKQVTLIELPLSKVSSVVYGMFVMKSEHQFDIVYVRDLDEKMKRFVICKELFHILIDEEQFRDMDIEGHLQALTTAYPRDDFKPRASVLAEFLAEVAAMQFLLPRTCRLEALGRKTPPAAVSDRYGVPLMFVERYMSEEWMRNLDPLVIQAA